MRRTAPNSFLEPLRQLPAEAPLLAQEITAAVQQYFQRELAALPPAGPAHPLARLTQREHEVLALLSKGDPDKEVALLLRLSIHTVHEHVRNIFEKLGVHNRTEAVVKFLQK